MPSPRLPDSTSSATSGWGVRLDALRAVAMFLGIAYHATTSWLPGVGPWYFVADADPQAVLVTWSGLLHACRMQLFFALSGFFAHLVFERRGARAFVIDRARRLLLPAAVALPVTLLADLQLRRLAHEWGLMAPDFALGTALRPEPIHLWFLLTLFVLCVIAWALPTWPAPARILGRAVRQPLLLLVLAVPTALGLWRHPELRPDTTFWPLPFELAHYGLFFAFGWWSWAVRASLPALGGTALVFGVSGLALGLWLYSSSWQWTPLGHGLAALVPWLITVAAFGWAFSPRPASTPPGLQPLVASSYWVYLVHYPVVMALQLAFACVAWPGALEYALTVLLTTVFALGTYRWLVQPTPLGRWLGATRARAS